MKKLASDARAALPALALLLALSLPWLGYCLLCERAGQAAAADAAVTIEASPKLIALTFDDGPRRATTTALLDGLAQRGVQATFFLIGRQIPGNEDILLRMESEGHQIGIHTYDHTQLTGLNQADFDAQVEKTRQLLSSILEADKFLLRPPYGMTDEGVRAMAGCPIVLWSIDPEDWGDRNAGRETAHILQEARDGSIILLHDIYPESVQAALQVVDQLHEQGYLFVTVDQLFSARNIQPEDGTVYRCAYP